MRVDQLVLLAVGGSSDGVIAGRTRLQKVVYFLSEFRRISAGYAPSYYGAYSEEVARSVESLVARGLVNEDVDLVPSAGPFEGRMYSYTLTDDGREILSVLADEFPDEYKALSGDLDKLLDGSPRTATLAVASKLHTLVKRSSTPVRAEDLPRLATRFGWTISADELRSGIEFLVKHGFVRKTRARSPAKQ